MKQLITFIILFTSLQGAWASEIDAALIGASPETIQTAQDFLAENPMDEFDSKRLKQMKKKQGEGFANEVYLTWIDTKQFGDSCKDLIGSCDYYLCREKLNPCGVKGYHLAFGYQHCQRSFTSLSQVVSFKGQTWLTDVATCLQQSMEDGVSSTLECKEIKKQSLDSHAKCYEQTNFCGQKLGDVLKVLNMLSPELAKPKMLILGLRIIKNCIL